MPRSNADKRRLIAKTRRRLNMARVNFLNEYRNLGYQCKELEKLGRELEKTRKIFDKIKGGM